MERVVFIKLQHACCLCCKTTGSRTSIHIKSNTEFLSVHAHRTIPCHAMPCHNMMQSVHACMGTACIHTCIYIYIHFFISHHVLAVRYFVIQSSNNSPELLNLWPTGLITVRNICKTMLSQPPCFVGEVNDGQTSFRCRHIWGPNGSVFAD